MNPVVDPSKKSSSPLTILITGASGLIGKALTQFLESQGHRIIKVSITQQKEGSLYWSPKSNFPIDDFKEIDVVIHLAGESIVQRWTADAKKRIYDSRIKTTEKISKAIVASKNRPKLLVVASAISIYQQSEKHAATEESPLVSDDSFINKVVIDWEAASEAVKKTEVRVIKLRISTLLSKNGGALASMLPLFRLGLGGPQGSGEQLVSWIDIDDFVKAVYFCILNSNIEGPVNLVAPQVVTNAEFSQAIAKVLHRPCFLRVPEFLLKKILKGFAEVLILKSYNVYPKKLLDAGFPFSYKTIDESLEHLLNPESP